MRILILLIMLMVVPLASGIEECTRVIEPIDIPCLIVSSWHPSGSCSDYNLSVYNQTGGNFQNLTWGEYTPFCNATWTISQSGTYHYNSSIESGVIVVKYSDMMLALVFGIGIVAGLFLWLAFKVDESHALLKLLLILSSVTMLILIPLSTFMPDNIGGTFYRLFLYIFIPFWLYVGLYFLYWVFQKMRRTVEGG